MKDVKLDRVGEKYFTNQGYEAEIIIYDGRKKCTIKLNDGTVIENIRFFHLKAGKVKNPNHKSACGVGFLGEGIYKKHVNRKQSKSYSKWIGMLSRCYYEEFLERQPNYRGVTVCEEWHNFQNFAKWHEENWKDYMDSSWDLDKDILVRGNKIYSPETCCFVPQEINNLFIKISHKDSKYRIGNKLKSSKTRPSISIYGVSKALGSFDTVEEAFNTYKSAKEKQIKDVAMVWESLIDSKVYNTLMSYKIVRDSYDNQQNKNNTPIQI